mmetsp:Transcript_10405/g.16491  ORF Transcript_10405/g.16491 Transcript_10405/m.16491 type:complete len:99 (+) Transcript_10405:224-520(+)
MTWHPKILQPNLLSPFTSAGWWSCCCKHLISKPLPLSKHCFCNTHKRAAVIALDLTPSPAEDHTSKGRGGREKCDPAREREKVQARERDMGVMVEHAK